MSLQKRKRVAPETVQTIVEMWKQGLSRSDIAKQLDMSVNTVRDILKRKRKEGVVEPRYERATITDEDYQRVASEFSMEVHTVQWLQGFCRKGRGYAAILFELRALCSLWSAQNGRCYYTGAVLGTDGDMRQAALVPSVGQGKVFVCAAVMKLRGNLTHKQFLQLTKAVAKYALKM